MELTAEVLVGQTALGRGAPPGRNVLPVLLYTFGNFLYKLLAWAATQRRREIGGRGTCNELLLSMRHVERQRGQ